MGKSGHKKWKVKEPVVFCLLFYIQSHEMQKKLVAGFASKQRNWLSCSHWILQFLLPYEVPYWL